MAELERVQVWAEALIRLHLDERWSFAFDHARTRAGLTNYTKHRIQVSRHVVAWLDDDAAHQILLHEVAHAIVGHAAGHGPAWKAAAADLGYVGGRLHDGPVAAELATWLGRCPAGHEHHRFRKPSRPTSCARCSRGWDPANTITWQRR